MTSEIASLMWDCDIHFKKAKGNKFSHHWKHYHSLRNKVHLGIKKAKSEYHCKLICDHNGNSRNLWKAIKEIIPSGKPSNSVTSITVDGIVHSSPLSIALAFNNFFVNIGTKFAERIFSGKPNSNNARNPTTFFSVQPISSDCVEKWIEQLKPNKV